MVVWTIAVVSGVVYGCYTYFTQSTFEPHAVHTYRHPIYKKTPIK